MSLCNCPLVDFPSTENVECKENFGQIQKVIFVDLRHYGKGLTNISTLPVDPQDVSAVGIFTAMGSEDMDGLIIDFIPTPDTDGVADGWLDTEGTHGILSLLELMSGGRKNGFDSNYPSYIGNPLVQISPFLQAPSQEPGEARTFGGGNDTPNGVEKFLGMGPSRFSAVMRGVPQDVIARMKELICLSKIGQLGVILVNGEGHIEMLEGPDVITQPDGEYAGNSSYGAYWPIPIRGLQISDKIHGGYEEPDYNEISWDFLPNYSDRLIVITSESFLNPGTSRTILDMKNTE